MGMTYKIIALPKGVTPKQYFNSDDIEDEELVDDLVFDRERLSAFAVLPKRCSIVFAY